MPNVEQWWPLGRGMESGRSSTKGVSVVSGIFDFVFLKEVCSK